MTRSLMLQGTGSDVGKTVLVAGLCRAAANRGIVVRPFKPQNMSNNAAVTADGGEIGRAQWLQALACRIAPSIHMNPVLLKPQSSLGSQIVVHGKAIGEAKGREYQKLKPKLLKAVMQSFDCLKGEADLVIVEGAGSPAEINLRQGDIANMGFAEAANVRVVLVGDIDRGGVMASLVGTHTILPPADRSRIAGYIINKFRGDLSLFDDGLTAIKQFTNWPSFGVVPWLEAVGRLPAEDSVALEKLCHWEGETEFPSGFRIVVPVLDRIANFDDLAPLQEYLQAHLSQRGDIVFVKSGNKLPSADLIIIPGSKSTISDLMKFRENGWDKDLARHVKAGGHVLGICGGYQMLGRKICDPLGIEGDVREIDGLGLLDVTSELAPEKRVELSSATHVKTGQKIDGYEIHLGVSQGSDCENAFAKVDGMPEGACSKDSRICGTYLHGLFDNDSFRDQYLASIGFEAAQNGAGSFNYRQSVDDALDELADELEKRLEIDALLNL